MKQRWFFILLFSIGVGFGGYYFSAFLRQHHSLGRRPSLDFVFFIMSAAIMQVVAHYVRAYKSKLLINNIRQTRTDPLFKSLSIGFLFNSLLPWRLGEIVRAFYIGDSLSISKTAAFISIVIERIVDGLILGICFITAGILLKNTSTEAFHQLTRIGLNIEIVTITLATIILIIKLESQWMLKAAHRISGIFNAAISDKLRFMTWSGVYGTKLMLTNQNTLRKFAALSFLMWALYFGAASLVVIAFFPGITLTKLWFTVQSSYAGISAPAGPGYVGTFHVIVSDLLQKIKLNNPGSFSLIIWLVMVGPISLIGMYVLIRQRFRETKLAADHEALINKLHREKDLSQELSHFLDAYLKGERINQVLTQAELEGKFKLIKSFKGGSNAHTMLVWQNEEMRVKKITLKQFADKLEAQAKWLIDRKHLDHLPRVIEEEETEHYYCFDLTYHEDFLSFFDYIHSHSTTASFGVLQKVLKFLSKSVYISAVVKDGRENVESYIETKVLRKIDDTATMNNSISNLMNHEKIVVNGVAYDNLPQIIEKIKQNKKAMRDLSIHHNSPIHGDLTVDNLIVSANNDFFLLDPNNENQVSSPVVDYGNLYQSLHSGYEFLIQLKDCKVKNNRIDFEDSKSHKYGELFKLIDKELKKALSPGDYRSILFHEAVQYCRMLTYRVSINPQTVPVFYATAVKLFNEYLEQYE